MDLIIAVADPDAADVRALLNRHLSFAQVQTPPEHVHALPSRAWADPDLTLFGARRDGSLMGVGAIRRLDDTHAELKAMHTRAEARGYRRVSLETGTMEAFAPARALYRKAGFRACPPFAPYTVNPYSVCMTLVLDPAGQA